MLGGFWDFFCIVVSAILAGKGLNALGSMGGLGRYHTVVKNMGCCLAFIADTETDMRIFHILLVDHPFTPGVVCQNRNILGIAVTADRAGIGLHTLFRMCGLLGNVTVSIGTILGFGFITDAGSGVGAVLVVRPIAPLVVGELGLGIDLYIAAIGAGKVNFARCQVGCPVDHSSIIKVVLFGLCFLATAGTDVGVCIVLFPITPAVLMLLLGD